MTARRHSAQSARLRDVGVERAAGQGLFGEGAQLIGVEVRLCRRRGPPVVARSALAAVRVLRRSSASISLSYSRFIRTSKTRQSAASRRPIIERTPAPNIARPPCPILRASAPEPRAPRPSFVKLLAFLAARNLCGRASSAGQRRSRCARPRRASAPFSRVQLCSPVRIASTRRRYSRAGGEPAARRRPVHARTARPLQTRRRSSRA